jgi:hypothetical protein
VGYSFYYPTGAIRETKLAPFPEFIRRSCGGFIRLRRDLSACGVIYPPVAERRTYMNLEEVKQFIKQVGWGMASPRK